MPRKITDNVLKDRRDLCIKKIEAAEAERIQELRKNHSFLFKKIDELDSKTTEIYSEDSPVSESVVVIEEHSESECEADEYMNDSEDYME